MTRTEAIATLAQLNTLNDSIKEYADSQEWSLKGLRDELKNAEDVTTLVQLDWVIAVRKEFRLTEDELDQIAGV
jgi:hypothetical protein